MNIPLDEVVFFDAIVTTPSTGAAVDADLTPTFAVYEESTDTDIGVGGNMTKRTSLTGNYRGSFTASAANGFEAGKWYSIIGSAVVGGVTGKARLLLFRAVAAESTAGVLVGSVASGGISSASFAAGAINAAAIAADAITDAKVASDVTIASVTGAVGSVTGNVGGNVVGSVASVTAAVTVGTINANAVTASALATDAVAEIADGVWDEATSGHSTAGSTGKALTDATAPTAAAVADAVWDEVLSGHLSAGSTGEALNAAGSAGDPWTTTLPGAYTGSQAGKILSDILVDTGTTLQAELDGIQADTEDIQTRLPAALVGGRIDASVGAMAANVLTASALATDAVTEIQSGLATATSVADVPTVAEFEARTILAASYATAVEVAKVIKTGEEFTATDGTGTKDVTFTRI